MGLFIRAKPQRQPQEQQAIETWLAQYRPLPCPPGTALGISRMEWLTGTVCLNPEAATFVQRINRDFINGKQRKALQKLKLEVTAQT